MSSIRVHNKTTSRLIKGLWKVIDQQNAKPEITEIDVGMNKIVRYKNKHVSELHKIQDFYFPLLWQPLRYTIKPVAHTHYTYTVSRLPMGENKLRKLKRYKNKNNTI